MTEKLVVGLDESPGGHRALFWALRYAQDTGADVEVVSAYQREATPWAYVAGPVDEKTWAEQEQAKVVKQIRAGFDHPVPVTCTVVEGPAVEVLCEAAAGADLLVLGSHGRGHLASILLGSTSADCIRKATTPVVIVPTHSTADHGAERAAEMSPIGVALL